MKKSCEAILLVVVMLFASASSLSAKDDSVVSSLLDTLDNAVKQRQEIIEKKQKDIDELTQETNQLTDIFALAKNYGGISAAYIHVNSDSAIAYAQKALETSEKSDDAQLVLYGKIGLLKAYCRKGDLAKAYEVITDIGDINGIAKEAQERYAIQLMEFTMRSQMRNETSKTNPKAVADAWNKYSHYINSKSPDYYFYQSFCGNGWKPDNGVRLLNSMEDLSFDYARLAFAIANEYHKVDNTDKYYEYLLISAISDIRLANTEVSSLLYLLQSPLLAKDPKRSYDYCQVLVDNVTRYHDLQRALTVVEIQNRINQQFNTQKNHCVIAASIAALLFLIALVFSMIQTRLLKHSRKKIRETLNQSSSVKNVP